MLRTVAGTPEPLRYVYRRGGLDGNGHGVTDGAFDPLGQPALRRLFAENQAGGSEGQHDRFFLWLWSLRRRLDIDLEDRRLRRAALDGDLARAFLVSLAAEIVRTLSAVVTFKPESAGMSAPLALPDFTFTCFSSPGMMSISPSSNRTRSSALSAALDCLSTAFLSVFPSLHPATSIRPAANRNNDDTKTTFFISSLLQELMRTAIAPRQAARLRSASEMVALVEAAGNTHFCMPFRFTVQGTQYLDRTASLFGFLPRFSNGQANSENKKADVAEHPGDHHVGLLANEPRHGRVALYLVIRQFHWRARSNAPGLFRDFHSMPLEGKGNRIVAFVGAG